MSNKVSLNLTPDTKVLIALTHTQIQPLDALCELIDNAIDSFDSAKKQGIIIDSPTIKVDLPKASDIESNKGSVVVSDNGPGLTSDAAEKALRAGFSGNNPYDTLGLFGMGFNISTGKIGSVTRFFSAREELNEAIEVIIDLNKINESKDYNVEAVYKDKGSFSHGTLIEISNWWPEGNANRGFVKTLISYGLKKIKEEIGRRYATILRQGNIKIYVNGVVCEPFEHCVWDDKRYVEKQKHGRIPAVYRFDEVIFTQKKCAKCTANLESFQTQCPACGSHEIRTIEERITGWVGIQRFDDLSFYGIDLIRNGRAIRISEKKAFFTFVDEFQNELPDYPIDSNYGRIVGEVHLNHVPVDFMKQDFQRSSPEWHRAMTFLRGNSSLQPTQPNADKNTSPIFKLFQGYRKVKTPGKTDMYMGTWNPVKEEPTRIERSVEKEFYERFKRKEPGFYDDSEWWKKVEEADRKPTKQYTICSVCGCQNMEDEEVCVGCQAILKGKNCISCGEYIPFSSKVCPKCGKSQEVEVIKPWTCMVCGAKNDPHFEMCMSCNSPKGTENYLTLEYLEKNSDKDTILSIPSCSITLENGQNSSPIKVDVYLTRQHIIGNNDDENIPAITFKPALDEITIFIDKTHKLFRGFSLNIEQTISNEVAEYIYMLNKSIIAKQGKHTIPFLSWQIIDKYYSTNLEENSGETITEIDSLIETIKEKLIISCGSELSEYYDLLSKDEQKELINRMINSDIDPIKLNDYKLNGCYIKYVPFSFLVSLFRIKPQFFFDGKVWSDTYDSLEEDPDVVKFMQERIKTLYLSCLDDLLYYAIYKDQGELVLKKTNIAIKLLKQKVEN